MKIKIIRKILAFMIAISTIATTPGLVSAMPKKFNLEGKKTSEAEKEEGENKICDEDEKEEENKICDEDEKEENGKDKYDGAMSKLEKLLNKNSLKKEEKKAFVDCVEMLIDHKEGDFKNFAKGKLTKILDVLYKCVECDVFYGGRIPRHDLVVGKILKIIEHLAWYDMSKYDFYKILDILYICRGEFHYGNYVSSIFHYLRNTVSIFWHDKEPLSKMANFLFGDEKKSDFNVYDFDVILTLISDDDFLNCCTPSQISKLIDGLGSEIDGKVFLQLVRYDRLSECGPQQISKVTNTFIKLLDSEVFLNSLDFFDVLQYKPNDISIQKFINTGVLKNLEKQQTAKIIDKLLKYFENCNEIPINIFSKEMSSNIRFNGNSECCERPGPYPIHEIYSKRNFTGFGEAAVVAKLIAYFSGQDYNNLKTDGDNAKKTAIIIKSLVCGSSINANEPKIIDILSECVKTDEAKKPVLAAITCMLDKDFSHGENFSVNIKTQMSKIINILKICSKDDDKKLAVSSIVGNLVCRGFLKGYSGDEILEVINILYTCSSDDMANENIIFSLEKLFFDLKLSSKMTCQFLDLLFKCAKKSADRGSIIKIIEYLTFRGEFKSWNSKEISKIIYFLHECCDDDKTQAASKIIEKLANSNLIRYNVDDMPLINDILYKCSGNKFSRKCVVNSIEQLLNNQDISKINGDFSKYFLYDHSGIQKIMSILDRCLDDCYGDVALKVVSLANLMKKSCSDVKNSDSRAIIEQFIVLLNKCSDNNIAKKECVKLINQLIVDGYFSSDYVPVTLELLKKCVEYEPIKDDVLIVVKSLVDCGYINFENVGICRNSLLQLLYSCLECDNGEKIFNIINIKFGLNG